MSSTTSGPHTTGRSRAGSAYAQAIDVDTPHGPARVQLRGADAPRGLVVLGHGAGGGVQARDLTAAARAAEDVGCAVALVEQPYRVAGRRSPAPARQLDAAWIAVLAHLRTADDRPVVTGGRSAGARVACRTAAETGAVGVLCLAFPLHAPRRNPSAELKTRLPELEAVEVPVLVVQGASDPFGMPPEGPGRRVVTVPGDHRLAGDLDAVQGAVRAWLDEVLRPTNAGP